MRYVQHVTLTPVPGVPPDRANYRANSAFDPDYFGGGHQPTSFGQWANFYEKYVVVGSRIRMYPVQSQTPSYYGITLANVPNELNATYGLNVDGLLESKWASRKLMITGNPDTNASKIQFAQKKYSHKRMFGNKPTQNQNAISSVDTNPSNTWYFTCWNAVIPNGTILPGTNRFRIEIDYIVVFLEPRLLTPGQIITLSDEKEAEKKMFLNQDFNENLTLGTNLDTIVDSLL